MIKPIYECQKCHNTFLNNLESHDGLELEETSGAPVLYSGNYKIIKCQGVLKPAILVDDLLKEIKSRIVNHKDMMAMYDLSDNPIQRLLSAANVAQIGILESLMELIKGSEAQDRKE